MTFSPTDIFTLSDTISLDDLSTGLPALFDGVPFDLGDGRIAYTWVTETRSGMQVMEEAWLSIYDLDGTRLVAPMQVDTATLPSPAGQFGYIQSIYAVTPGANGGFTVHFNVEDSRIYPLNDTSYTRGFDASGTALGAAQAVSGDMPYLLPGYSVPLLLSGGDIAIAQDDGLIILDGTTGAVTGGTDDIDNTLSARGYALEEADDGRILMMRLGYDGVLTGQYHLANGTADGAAFTVTNSATTAAYGGTTVVRAAVAMDILEDGRIAVAWTGEDFGDDDAAGSTFFPDTAIVVTILNADGTESVAPFLGNPDAIGEAQYSPGIFAMEGGGFVLGYESNDTDDGQTALWRLQAFTADGVAAGSSVLPVASLTGTVSQVHSIIGEDGTGLIIDELGSATQISIDPDAISVPGLLLSGGSTDDVLPGGDGADTIDAGRGDDTVTGGAGADDITAGVGDDEVDGGAGADMIRGGKGRDSLSGGDGDDIMRGQSDGDLMYGGAGADNVKGGGGNDTLYGGEGNDFLKGGSRRDVIYGGDDDDRLLGNSFDDSLYGGAGNDTLKAGGEDDILDGGAGDDLLKGGSGADVFVFDTAGGADTILDFETEDRLLLSSALADGQSAADIAAAARITADGVLLDLGDTSVLLSGWSDRTGLADTILIDL